MVFRAADRCQHCIFLLPAAFLLNSLFQKSSKAYQHASVACFGITLLAFGLDSYATRGKRRKILAIFLYAGYVTITQLNLDILDNLTSTFFLNLLIGSMAVVTFCNFHQVFPNSFSECEMTLVLQGVLSYLSISIGCAFSLSKVIDIGASDFCFEEKSSKVLQLLFLGIAAIAACNVVIIRKSRSKLILYASIGLGMLVTYSLLTKSLRQEPLFWLQKYLTDNSTKITLLTRWAIILAVSIALTALWSKYSRRKASTVVRKFYHVVISAVFITGMQDPPFLSFAMSCLLVVFLLCEVIRFSALEPFAGVIEKCFESFRDDKDSGYLTLTHIYLLVGCALPLWIYPTNAVHSLLPYSGLISIGFGDTAASVVGSLFGRNHWPDSLRTVEGSFAAAIVQVVASIWMWDSMNPEIALSAGELFGIFIVSNFVSYVEASTSQIDNLFLPVYHNLSMCILRLFYLRI